MNAPRALPLLLLTAAAQASVMTYTVSGTYSAANYMPADLRGQPFTVTEVFNTLTCGPDARLGAGIRCGAVHFDLFWPSPDATLVTGMYIDRVIPGYTNGGLWLFHLSPWPEGQHRWVAGEDPPMYPSGTAQIEWEVTTADKFALGGSLMLVNHTAGTVETTSRPNPEPGTWWLMAAPLAWWGWRRWMWHGGKR